MKENVLISTPSITEPFPKDHFLFTSESVGEGHPDKLCDQISDAILDACINIDPEARVCCEVSAKRNQFIILGDIGIKGEINIKDVVTDVVKQVGFDQKEKGLDFKDINVHILVHEDSSAEETYVPMEDIKESDKYLNNQGVMFGYATDEWDSETLLPLSHYLASKICERAAECRKLGIISWLRPDCKSQVTIEYKREGNLIIPLRVHNVLLSTQHSPEVPIETIQSEVIDKIIRPVIPVKFLDSGTLFYVNPSKSFTVGGPMADAGLTGRKIIVDTYGGWAPHGGGAFSGKDPSKVERCGAYYARYVAKSLVHAGLCHRALIQVSYSMGLADPLAIYIDTFGTTKEGKSDSDLMAIIKKNFNFRVENIIEELQLRQPIYAKTSVFGHFGRSGPEFRWEVPKEIMES